jgi:hypothetical protein
MTLEEKKKLILHSVFITLFLIIGFSLVYEMYVNNEFNINKNNTWGYILVNLIVSLTIIPFGILFIPFILINRLVFGKLKDYDKGGNSLLFGLFIFTTVFVLFNDWYPTICLFFVKNELLPLVRIILSIMVSFIITKKIFWFVYKKNM